MPFMDTDPLAPLDQLRAQLAQQTTPTGRARIWGQILKAWPDLHRAIADARRADIVEARETMTDAQIGEELDMHWASVSRIARGAGRATPKTGGD
jgi:hypothetical protein